MLELLLLLALAILVAAIWKPLTKTIFGALDGHADKVRAELDEAKRLREQAQTMLAEHQRQLAGGEGHAKTIVEHARTEAERQSERHRAELAAALERRTAQALDRIAQEEGPGPGRGPRPRRPPGGPHHRAPAPRPARRPPGPDPARRRHRRGRQEACLRSTARRRAPRDGSPAPLAMITGHEAERPWCGGPNPHWIRQAAATPVAGCRRPPAGRRSGRSRRAG